MGGIELVQSDVHYPVFIEELAGYDHTCKPSFRTVAQLNGGWNSPQGAAAVKLGIELPSVENLIYVLQKCRKEKNLQLARHLHTHIHDNDLEAHTVLGDYLVPTFVECGSVFDAQQVFFRLAHPNEYSWTSLIRGYTDCGDLTHALNLYQKMLEDCVHPSKHTFLALLQACARMKDTGGGFEVHTEIIKEGFEEEPFVGNALVDMYAKCGSFTAACEVFDELQAQDVVSWTALISGYVEHMLGEEAICCLEKMKLKGVFPNAVTLVCSLKACQMIGAIDMGREIHLDIVKQGLEGDAFVVSALVGMYAKCGSLAEGQEVFDNLPVRDVVSWNALITGYADHKLVEETLKCLEHMQQDGMACNAVSFVCSLKACGSLGTLERGQEVHAEIAREGFEEDFYVSSSLVDMYAKCDSLVEAQDIFDKMQVRGLVSWSALIAGYAQYGCGKDALRCFEQMQVEGLSPDAVTFLCCLKACGSIRAIGKGREMHLDITKEGLEGDHFINSALLNMYAKCGSLLDAWEVFNDLPVQGVVSWNALIAGYVEHGFCKEAQGCLQQMQLEGVFPNVVSWNAMILGFAGQGGSNKAFLLYAQMQEQGLLPDSSTFVSILNACAGKTDLEAGRKLHSQVYKSGRFKGLEPIVATAVIDMYSKCGSMVEAQQVFDAMPMKDLVGWTALITGYGRQGESELVFHLFERMKQEGLQPNKVTFLSILSACSHVGLVDEGQAYFDAMGKEYGISPTIQHHNCMVDLHRRAGQLDKAVVQLKNMPFQPNPVTWSTVLSSCGE